MEDRVCTFAFTCEMEGSAMTAGKESLLEIPVRSYWRVSNNLQ